ncbi:hypothetical protein GS610_15655 [Ruegeria sp. HKCCD6228]|uniref:hypothetical protein n=1 Tax=unclassified Ruegeria TaxID=2625375 RepID=UPI0014889E8A|nr:MULTISPECIES: hypothetical protein [unclassified Ruegeria]NOD98642.1 hypothetical protein [Ruegeria sp. HKCCD6228]
MAATTVPAAANEKNFASETIAACQSTTDLASLTDTLTKHGWSVSAPADLDDRAIRSYAATFLYNHLGFGDVPDPRIASTWEQAIKNAAGVRNLKQIETSQKKDRWFVREQSGSILRVDSFEHEVHGRLSCLLALKDEDSPFTFQQLLGDNGRDPQTLPPVYHLRPQSSEGNGLKRSLKGAILNTERISTVSESHIDVATVYSTFTSKHMEKSE